MAINQTTHIAVEPRHKEVVHKAVVHKPVLKAVVHKPVVHKEFFQDKDHFEELLGMVLGKWEQVDNQHYYRDDDGEIGAPEVTAEVGLIVGVPR